MYFPAVPLVFSMNDNRIRDGYVLAWAYEGCSDSGDGAHCNQITG